MALRAIFFDLDETLINTSGTEFERAERIVTLLKRERPDLDGQSFVDRFLANRGTLRALVREFGLEGTSLGHEVVELWFFQGCLDLARTFPGTEPALRELSQVYKLGVITNGLEYRQRAKFESLGIHQFFDGFLSSETAGVEKPAPEIFELALAEADVGPSEAVFIGDRLDLDVLGAQEAGIRAIWLDHRGRVPSGSGPKPDETFTDFRELPSILFRLDGR